MNNIFVFLCKFFKWKQFKY